MRSSERNREIAHHIFNGSTTMIGVCVTVIALFRALKASLGTYADEILGFNTFVFIAATICAYASLRRDNNIKLERCADILFFTGMLIMLIVGVIIVYSTY